MTFDRIKSMTASADDLKEYFKDIRFWIVFFFLIRLVGITNAPLERTHNWRQALTNMITRNFVENGPNVLYPMVDFGGDRTGIIGSEFPFYNFLVYLLATVFEYNHWLGRITNLVVSSVGIFYFFKLTKAIINKKTAFNATIILLVSTWFAFSRKIMPDTFSTSLLIISLYYGYIYLKKGNNWSLLLFFILSSLGLLCKIPVLCLFSAIGTVLLVKEVNISRKVIFLIAALCSTSLMGIWYFYWVPYLVETYAFQLYFPKSFTEGFLEIKPLIPSYLEQFYYDALHSYVAFACFVCGLFVLIKNKNPYLKAGLGIITFTFLAFTIKTGSVFPTHGYYIIPFVPVMALVAGLFLSILPAKFTYIILGFICLEGIANQQHDFFVRKDQLYKLTLEEKADQFIPKEDLVIINGGYSPQGIYFSNRKGWAITNEESVDTNHIAMLVSRGAKFLIIDKSQLPEYRHIYPALYEDASYIFYKLD